MGARVCAARGDGGTCLRGDRGGAGPGQVPVLRGARGVPLGRRLPLPQGAEAWRGWEREKQSKGGRARVVKEGR